MLCFVATAQKIEVSVSYVTSIPDLSKTDIVHNGNNKLSIDDFTGEPDNSSPAVAITSSGFNFKSGFRSLNGKATMQISVYSSFDKQLSWMKEKGRNEYILSHEQHHFDISYIGALWFIQKIKKIAFKKDGYSEQLRAAYYDAVEKMQELQKQYDEETGNGTLKDKQAAWITKIDKLRASLQTAGS